MTAGEGDAVLLRSTTYAKYCNGIQQKHYLVQNWTGNTLVKVSDRYDTYLRRYERVNPKNAIFRENLTFDLT